MGKDITCWNCGEGEFSHAGFDDAVEMWKCSNCGKIIEFDPSFLDDLAAALDDDTQPFFDGDDLMDADEVDTAIFLHTDDDIPY